MTVARLPIHDSRRRPPGVARNRITPAHTSQDSRLFSSPNCASACLCCARVARLVRPPIEQSVSSGDLAGRRGSPRRPHEGFRGCRVGNTKGWSCQAGFGGSEKRGRVKLIRSRRTGNAVFWHAPGEISVRRAVYPNAPLSTRRLSSSSIIPMKSHSRQVHLALDIT